MALESRAATTHLDWLDMFLPLFLRAFAARLFPIPIARAGQKRSVGGTFARAQY
jgi:hypothetical protein